jgi:hypothetical protein
MRGARIVIVGQARFRWGACEEERGEPSEPPRPDPWADERRAAWVAAFLTIGLVLGAVVAMLS